MKRTESIYSKAPKVNLREIKLSDIFKNNNSGIFRIEGADEEFLDNWLDEAKSIVSEKHLTYQIQFRDEGIFLGFYPSLNL
ncbi:MULTISPECIES: hypothetical protein [unclassified Clostridioides]|uniref:hypothetical protein n=1 Tax=unclassified Clostridioides TaxID=2635829 RepID=UPI001D0FB795|nr:hypothetical protein [Clostridioides sp. ZZV14-6045]MCC0740796.1 hypothetical protein [Clostridioides sp. ZZV14-5902]